MEATKRVSIEATKRESMEANTGDDDAFYLFLQKQSINEDVLTISSARFRVQSLGFRVKVYAVLTFSSAQGRYV